MLMSPRSFARRLVGAALLVSLVACGGTGPAPAPTPIPATTDGDPPPTAVTPAPAETGELAVVLRHGPMTYVMDSLRGQLDKAGVAVRESDLFAALTGLGLAVTVDGVLEGGDDVVVETVDGTELGRLELHDVDRGAVPDGLMADVRAHFGI
ncbi:MAG: hypothetical protein R2939_01340 [Kofleriaceae bacterium]